MMKAVSHAAAIFLHRHKRANFVNKIYIKYSYARDNTRQELIPINNVIYILSA